MRAALSRGIGSIGGKSLAKRDLYGWWGKSGQEGSNHPNFDCFTFALQSSFILFHRDSSTSLVNKPYTKRVKHSEEVEWWRTFMVECVTI